MAQTFKELLSGKIPNEHYFRMLLTIHGQSMEYGKFRIDEVNYQQSWWAHREHLRMVYEVYETTPPLNSLSDVLPLYCHISTLDRTKVAYTPDKSFGERDAQLATTIGKLLTKHYPALRDEVIESLSVAHTSELNNDVEFIEHGNIADSYTMFGDNNACMSKGKEHYGGFNPAEAYDVPGVRLAVLRGENGKISSRGLVWEKSETEKIFLRCYPAAGVLEKRLKKLGYVAGTWLGMKFKTIKRNREHSDRDMFVFPYLDGMGSVGSCDHSSVACLDGVITCVSFDYASKLKNISAHGSATATSTAGYVCLKDMDTANFSVTDYITGERFSRFENHKILWVDDVEYVTRHIPDSGWASARTIVNGQSVTRLMKVECTSYIDGRTMDTSKLERLGYVLLDPEWYPPIDSASKYVRAGYYVKTHSGRNIRTYDQINYISKDVNGAIHKSELVTAGKQKDIKLSTEYYCSHDTKLYFTPSGRKVHPLSHKIVMLWDGVYDFPRNTVSVSVMGKTYYIPKELQVPSGEGSDLWNKRFLEVEAEHLDLRAQRDPTDKEYNSLSYLATNLYYSITYNTFRGYDKYGDRIQYSYTMPIEREIARIRLTAAAIDNAAARATMRTVEKVYAEMCAVEAPLMYVSPDAELVGPVRPVVEIPDIAVDVPMAAVYGTITNATSTASNVAFVSSTVYTSTALSSDYSTGLTDSAAATASSALTALTTALY